MASALGNVFKGQTTAVANAKLTRAIRAVLADDEARIRAEARVDLPRAIWNQATTPQHVVALASCVALLAAYIYGADSGGRHAAHSSIIVCIALLLASIAVNISLVCLRLHRLRWEVHNRVANAVLEFERACTPLRPSSPAPGPAGPVAAAAAAVFVDGAVVHAGSAWRALDFHDPSKSMHTVPVYRDGAWVRLPVLLLVRGDLIALLGGEPAPTRGRCVDAGGTGRRSSMTALYRNFRAAQQGHSRRSSSAGAPFSRPASPRPEPRQGRVRDVEVLTLCGDMRRYALDDTPAAVALRKRLRTPHRPQPLFLTQLRSMGRLALVWQGGLGLAAAVAVIVRSVLNPSGAPDAQPDGSAVVGQPPAVLVGALEGVLMQLPTLLLCLSPLTLSTVLALCELFLTAAVLAAYELALLRFKWKAWKRDLNLRLLVIERAELHGQQASAVAAATAAAVAVDAGSSVELRSRHAHKQRDVRSDGAAFGGLESDARPAAAPLSWARWLFGPRSPQQLQRTDALAAPASDGPDAPFGADPSPAGATGDALHPFIVDGDGAAAQPPEASSGDVRPAGDHPMPSVRVPESAEGMSGESASLVSRLLQAARAAGDVGGVSLEDGEFLPRAYTDRGPAAVGMPALLLDDVLRDERCPIGAPLPRPVRVPACGGWFSCASRHCVRRKTPLPVRRVFDGAPFQRVVAHWTGPSSSRILFYFRRLLCASVRPARLASAAPQRPAPSSALRSSSHRHHHHHHLQPAALQSGGGVPNPDPASQLRSETVLQRWSNSFFADALIDVGFGLSPVASPLSSSQILLRLGSATVFCCADRSTVSDPDPVVENVLLLKGETGSTIIDLHADDASPTGIRFDDGRWKKHVGSLKPVGLACLLNSREAAANAPLAASAADSGALLTQSVTPAAAASTQAPTPDAKPRRKRSKKQESKLKPKVDPESEASGRGASSAGETAQQKTPSAGGALSLRSLVPNLLRRGKPSDVPSQPQQPGRGVTNEDSSVVSSAVDSNLPAAGILAPAGPIDYSTLRPPLDPSAPEYASGTTLIHPLPPSAPGADPARSSLLSRVLRGSGVRPQVTFVTADSPRETGASAPAADRDGDSSSVGSSKPPRSTRFRLPFSLKRQLDGSSARRLSDRPDGENGESASGVAPAPAGIASLEPATLDVVPLPAHANLLSAPAVSQGVEEGTVTPRVEPPTELPDPGAATPSESAARGKFSLSSIIPGGLRGTLSVRKWMSPPATGEPAGAVPADAGLSSAPVTESASVAPPSTLDVDATVDREAAPTVPAAISAASAAAPVCGLESITAPEESAVADVPRRSGSASASDDESESESDATGEDDRDAVSEYSFDSSESDGEDGGGSEVEDEESGDSDESGAASDSSSVDSARLERLQQRQARMARRIPLAPSADDDVSEPRVAGDALAPSSSVLAASAVNPQPVSSAPPRARQDPASQPSVLGVPASTPPSSISPRRSADANSPRLASGRRRVSAAASLYRSALSRRLLAGRVVAQARSPLQAHSSFAGDLVTTAASDGVSSHEARAVRGDSCGSGSEIIEGTDLAAAASPCDGSSGASTSRVGPELRLGGPQWLQSPLLLRSDDEYIVGLSDHTAASLDERLQPRTVETLYRSHAFTISGGVLGEQRRRSSPALPEQFKRPSLADASSEVGDADSASGFKSPTAGAMDSSNVLTDNTPSAAEIPEVVPRDRGDEQWTASGGIVRANSSSALDRAEAAVEMSPDIRPARQASSRHRHRQPANAAESAAGQRVSRRLSPTGAARRRAGNGAVLPHVNVDELVQAGLARIAAEDDGSLSKLAAALRDVPSRTWLNQLANEMGFTMQDVANFTHVRHIYTVVSGGSSESSPNQPSVIAAPLTATKGDLSVSHKPKLRARQLQLTHDTPWLKPALLSSVVTDERTGRMQMLSQGNLPFLLANCSEYYDGSTIWPLTQSRRAALLSTYQQWRAEDLTCTALAYDPVSNQEAALFQLLDAALKHSPHGPLSEASASEPSHRRPKLTSEDVGLGFDAKRVFLLAREGDVRLNAQVDARSHAKHNDHVFAQYQALLSGDVHDGSGGAASGVPVDGDVRTEASVASLVEARLMRMLSGQIFVGLVASRLQPRRKMQETIKDLDEAGIRFCFMSNRSYRKVRPLAQKMGLETGWNCAISLMPRKARAGRAGLSHMGGADAAAASTKAKMSEEKSGGLGQFGLDDDEEDFGVEGVLTDEKRSKLLRSAVDEQTWDQKAQLPHGIPEIRTHLQEIDNVPLLVSLFTESTPPAIAGMLRIMQENGEMVVVLCAALRKSSPLLFSVADLGVAVLPHPLTICRGPLRRLTLDANAAYVQGYIPHESVPAFIGALPAAEVVSSPASATDRTPPLAAAAPLPPSIPTVFEPPHPQLLLASTLASLHCALVLPGDAPPHVLLRVLNEARRGCDAMRQSLSFALCAQLSLALLVLVDIAAALPPILPLYYLLFLVWVAIPCIALPILTAPPDSCHMTTKRMPIKRSAGTVGAPLWDILPAPTVSADSLPAAPRDVEQGPAATAPAASLGLSLDAASPFGVAIDPAVGVPEDVGASGLTGLNPPSDGSLLPGGGGRHQSLDGGANFAADLAAAGPAEPGHEDSGDASPILSPLVYVGDVEGDEEVLVQPALPDVQSPLPSSPRGRQVCPPPGVDTVDPIAAATEGLPLQVNSGDPQPEAPPAGSVPEAHQTEAGQGGGGDVTRGATAYNPVTGGVHAEGLIRYGTYRDACGVLAGNVVDITAASAERLVSMLRTVPNAPAPAESSYPSASRAHMHPARRGGSRKADQPLSSMSAAAAAASFSMGIAPAQGLLDTPPPPPLPVTWVRLTVYALVSFVPSAIFHIYVYARVFYAGLALDNALASGGPAWGGYPPINAIATAAQIELRAEWARALTLWVFVVWLAGTSSHFVYRSLSWREASPLRCRAWVAGCFASITLTLAFCHLCTAAAGAPSLFMGSPWDAWLAIVLFNGASLILVGTVKKHDGRLFQRLMMSLRLYFDTRLGMYSPR